MPIFVCTVYIALPKMKKCEKIFIKSVYFIFTMPMDEPLLILVNRWRAGRSVAVLHGLDFGRDWIIQLMVIFPPLSYLELN